MAKQRPDGGWAHLRPLGHTFPLQAGWVSAMAQGQGASLLVSLHGETGEERFAEAALQAIQPMRRGLDEGGVQALLDGGPYPEEYPTRPPSFVLNGGIHALWDFMTWRSRSATSRRLGSSARGVDVLAGNIERWDTGWWSRYDLLVAL